MNITLSLDNPADYTRFLAIRRLPRYSFTGRQAWFPDEYASVLGMKAPTNTDAGYKPAKFLFDYQIAISRMAIAKRKYAVFAAPGLGKTLIIAEWLRAAADKLPKDKKLLIVCPLMVIRQTIEELTKFYGDDFVVEHIKASNVQSWLNSDGNRFGITNFESVMRADDAGRLGALAIDESSIMKSAYGTIGRRLIRLGRQLDWKLCSTGTPAPNDRIEYASHAVFLDQARTVNEFLARYFVNRGQTDNRWELKPHALKAFYRDLSHWCIFLSNPGVYGWKDNCDNIPPIHVHIEDVPLTAEQREAVFDLYGQFCVTQPGGITKRSQLSRIAKGSFRGKTIPTLKYDFMEDRVKSWSDESTIIWCWFNKEQMRVEKHFPDAASVKGETKYDRRIELVDDFKAKRRRQLISKAKVLGYGLNLQVATRHMFSSLIDSYESYVQCIKRSNRVGSTRPLNVHIPILEIEAPMVDTVLRKAHRVEQDDKEQEALFREVGYVA